MVCEVRSVQQHINVYLVEDLLPIRRCPNCAAEITEMQTNFCTECGSDLSDVSAVHLRYVVQESDQAHRFAVEAQWLAEGWYHPGIYLPISVFEEVPYGDRPRYYRVTPEFSPPLASDLPVPYELNNVLEWGAMLADAMAYLHQNNCALNSIALDRITVNGKAAQWLDLNQVQTVDANVDSAARKDVQGLASTLLYWATGRSTITDGVLPDSVVLFLEHALDLSKSMAAEGLAKSLLASVESRRRPKSVFLRSGQCTDVGRLRSLNEDALLTLDMSPVFRSQSCPVGVFLVADGMGGHEAGDVASELTARRIARRAVSDVLALAALGQPLPDAQTWLTEVVQAVNRQVCRQRRELGNNMGATLVLALCIGATCTVANVGDSRCYHMTPEGISQITTDHSLVERLVASGQITREEAVNHPRKNVIYRVIGDKPKIEVDISTQDLASGEALLLCSDGLSGMVSDDEIWQIWTASLSSQEASERLVAAANQAGGEDNISVIVVQSVA
jgi:protein phosphatase